MHAVARRLILGLSVYCACLLPALCRSEVTIKGLTLGMTIDEALDVVNSRIAPELGCREFEIVSLPVEFLDQPRPNDQGAGSAHGYAIMESWDPENKLAIQNGEIEAKRLEIYIDMRARSSPIIVQADQDRIVKRITFESRATDKLFLVRDMSHEDFAKAIMENYGVPELKPYEDWEILMATGGWEYSSPEGYRIRIKTSMAGLALPGAPSIELVVIPKEPERKFD
jgi:hypothetical protein